MGRWHLGGYVFVPTFALGVNGGFWQLSRRKEKIKRMADFENLDSPALNMLPTVEQPAGEFTRIRLEGTFDNEGSMLVGPRPKPDHQNRIGGDTSRGGFLVMTPFEVAHTRQFIMVNRGWVPIEACKSRLHLLQFIGEGFKPTTINGVIRKEEAIKKFFKSDCAENHQPCAGGMSWQVIRPYDMAIYYFKRRFGGDNLVYRQELHGSRRYCVEMLEDMSGEDQVLVKGQALPYRRTVEELTYISLPPLVHLGYSIFWFGVAVGSLWSLKVCFQQHKLQVAKAKLAARQAKELQESITKTSQLYKEEVRKVIESKMHQQRVELPGTPADAAAAASAAAAAGAAAAATAAATAGKTTP